MSHPYGILIPPLAIPGGTTMPNPPSTPPTHVPIYRLDLEERVVIVLPSGAVLASGVMLDELEKIQRADSDLAKTLRRGLTGS